MTISITGTYSKAQGFQFSESHYYDFITQSEKNFYYIDDSTDLIKKQTLLNFFVNIIKKNQSNWNNISNQERAQIGKIPNLYHSLLKENSLRFPIVFSDQKLMCGYGRAITVDRYFPDIKLPGIVISNKSLPYYKIKDINDLMSIITNYSYWKDKDLSKFNFGFVVDDDDIIHATDYQNKDERFLYKFIEDAGTIDSQWQKVMSVISSYQDINNQTIQEIIDQLIRI